jgi:hypothetical protein
MNAPIPVPADVQEYGQRHGLEEWAAATYRAGYSDARKRAIQQCLAVRNTAKDSAREPGLIHQIRRDFMAQEHGAEMCVKAVIEDGAAQEAA